MNEKEQKEKMIQVWFRDDKEREWKKTATYRHVYHAFEHVKKWCKILSCTIENFKLTEFWEKKKKEEK